MKKPDMVIIRALIPLFIRRQAVGLRARGSAAGLFCVRWCVLALLLTVMPASLYLQTPSAAAQNVRVGVYQFAPMIFNNNGQPGGLFIDILQEAAREKNWNIIPVTGTWNECMERLQSGEIELIACTAVTETREKTMNFGQEYLFVDWAVLYRTTEDQINSYTDLNGKVIAALNGSVYTENLSNLLLQFGINARIEVYPEYAVVLDAVSRGKADAGVCTKVYGLQLEDRYPRVEASEMIFSPQKLRYAVKKGHHTDLIAGLDQVISNLKSDRNSLYYHRLSYWLDQFHRNNGIPFWLKVALIIAGAGLLLAAVLIIALRIVVERQTRELRARNRNLMLEILERRQAEEAREETEADLAALLSNRPESIWSINRQYQYVIINDSYRERFEQIFGIDLKAGMSALEILPLSHRQYWKDKYDAVLNGASVRFEYISHERKEPRYYAIDMNPVRVKNTITGVSVISADISVMKREEMTRAAAIEDLELAQSVAHVGSWTWYIQSGTLEWSKEMYRIFGVDPLHINGNLQDVVARSIHPYDRAAVEASNRKVMEEGNPIPMEYRILRPDGSERVVWAQAGKLTRDQEGKPEQLRGIVMDITERKKAEAEVARGLELFQKAFRGNPAAMLIIRFSDWEILDCNESFTRILGYSAQDTRGKLASDFKIMVNPVEEQGIINSLRDEGRIFQRQVSLRSYDGNVKEVLLSMEKALIRKEDCLICIFLDITDLRQSGLELKKSSEMMRTAFESVDGAVFLADTVMLSVMDSNQRTQDLFSFSRTELFGSRVSRLFAEGYSEFLQDAREAWERGEEYSADVRLQRKNGQEFPGHCHSRMIMGHDSKPLAVFLIFYDISDQRNFELELINARDYYIRLFENFPTLIWRSGTDGICNYFNKTWLNFTGRTIEQEMGNGWTEGVHPDDFQQGQEIYSRSFEQRKPFQIEYRLMHHSGEYRWIMDNGIPFEDLNGQFAGYIGSCYDIHAMKAMEHNLLDFNSTLGERVREEVQKNREKDLMLIKQSREALMGEMMHNVAHQWRQPLNSIGVILQNMESHFQSGKMTPEYFRDKSSRVMNLLLYMSHTIDDFRNFFRIDKVRIRFSLSHQVAKSVGLVDYYFKTMGILVSADVADDLYSEGFPNEFGQVLLNLFNNAKDIILERQVKNGQIRVSGSRNHGRIEIRVMDNGGGVPAGILERIFEPYFTTKDQGKGTGIGLFMSKMIIERNMQGTMAVSNTTEGACFTITLNEVTQHSPGGRSAREKKR